ncbi:MAG TPA: SLC13 family permease [Acidimicrobiales bacterium]|nr:SLC13 family permease [Acidimicrobiales bacterium]
MSTAAPAVLLAVAVAGMLAPQLRRASWLPPALLAGVAVASGVVSPGAAGSSVRPLVAPLAFVALAVPMAVMLDRYGLFAELAELVASGRRYVGALWVLAAVTTATLNLDVAVVLLSPLYVRIAQRRGTSAFALALQPALLSSLASSALPVSNLTNLIAAAHSHVPASAFVEHLGLATLVATVVGWLCYRRGLSRIEALDPGGPGRADGRTGAPGRRRPDRARVLALGGALVVAVVAGFVVAPSVGAEPYEVVAVADVLLVLETRSLPLAVLPWRIIATVLGLGVLASAAAGHLPLAGLLSGSSLADIARTTAVSAVGANVVNNLPALLVALPFTGHHASWALWAVLLGTNVGPLVLPGGSLAVLLWISTVRRLGVPVRDRDFVRVGWWIGLPALAASTGALLVVRLVLGAAH